MSYKIVVARCGENIEWLRSEMPNCIIYNKGPASNFSNEVQLKNVGRESETYLNYIIQNYANLPDAVVFTQARISDHRGADDVRYLIKLKDEALSLSKSNGFSVHNDTGTCNNFDKKWNVRKDGYFLKDNYKDNKPVAFDEWFKANIDPHYPNPIYLYGNAIFAVKKELILNKPVEYYKRLITEVNHHVNPAEGHFFERSWYYIFR
jgi:hypothetical protein